MKTIYSIGRDPGSDIYLYDDRNVISRTHAILKIGKRGKYYISDQSMNGTYVNGIKISPGVQVPVTRKDVISFAHIAELDWEMVPKSRGRIWLYISLPIAVAALTFGIVWGVHKYMDAKTESTMISTFPSAAAETEKSVEEDDKFKELEEALKAEKRKRKEMEKKAKEAEKAKEAAKETASVPAEQPKDTLTYDPII